MPFVIHPTLAKDSVLVGRSGQIQIRLMDDSRYFWLILVPETGATELHQLPAELANELWRVIRQLGHDLQQHTNADKLNNAAIGNMVPQLHFHLVARHIGDADWPKPIWGAGEASPLAGAAKTLRINSVQNWIGNL